MKHFKKFTVAGKRILLANNVIECILVKLTSELKTRRSADSVMFPAGPTPQNALKGKQKKVAFLRITEKIFRK